MAEIPQLSDTGGAYWPTVGTIPLGDTFTGLEIDSNVDSVATRCQIQATSNPGVDPIDINVQPYFRRGDWVYADGQLVKVVEVYYLIEDHTLKFETDPAFSPAISNQTFQIVRPQIPYLSIVNNGAGAATVGDSTFPVGMSADFPNEMRDMRNQVDPIKYDATGTTLTIQVKY